MIKQLRLNDIMRHRVRKANYEWNGDTCPIDGLNFHSNACLHWRTQCERVYELVKNEDGVI